MICHFFNRHCRALVLLAALLEFSAPAQLSFIYTNAGRVAIPRRSSIIVIQCEGLGYGDLSCYGQTNFATPNLDKLAAEGMRFTNYTTAAAGVPALAAVLLGRHPEPSGAENGATLTRNETTVAELLQKSGYRTSFIGEWLLGDEHSAGAPWRNGFDEFGGYFNETDAGNFYAGYIFRYVPKTIFNETNNQLDNYTGREPLYYNSIGQKSTYIPDLYSKMTVNYVKEHAPREFNHYRPFFLMVDYKIPTQKFAVPTDAPFSEEPWPQAEKNRAALISRLDGYVGDLRQQLQKLDMTNNVAIFFSSLGLPQKGDGMDPLFFHSMLSTNDLRAPMIVNWPGKIPAGIVSGFKWSPRDFLPTAAQIAFLQSPANTTGDSVLPVLLGQTLTNSAATN